MALQNRRCKIQGVGKWKEMSSFENYVSVINLALFFLNQFRNAKKEKKNKAIPAHLK